MVRARVEQAAAMVDSEATMASVPEPARWTDLGWVKVARLVSDLGWMEVARLVPEPALVRRRDLGWMEVARLVSDLGWAEAAGMELNPVR
jgi:hypothetical protein